MSGQRPTIGTKRALWQLTCFALQVGPVQVTIYVKHTSNAFCHENDRRQTFGWNVLWQRLMFVSMTKFLDLQTTMRPNVASNHSSVSHLMTVTTHGKFSLLTWIVLHDRRMFWTRWTDVEQETHRPHHLRASTTWNCLGCGGWTDDVSRIAAECVVGSASWRRRHWWRFVAFFEVCNVDSDGDDVFRLRLGLNTSLRGNFTFAVQNFHKVNDSSKIQIVWFRFNDEFTHWRKHW